MITIIDYQMGNLGSVQNMFRRIGIASEVTGDLEKIAKAEKILLPGVGAFDAAMKRIASAGLREVLEQKALHSKIPVLGICLGMQLLTRSSEEGNAEGLGWVPAKTVRFDFANDNLKVPHMGWNGLSGIKNHDLLKELPQDTKFYFVHSYHVKADSDDYVLAKTSYGYEFDSIITNGENIFGAQFHPEKSHRFGMKLLENFAKL